MFFIFIILWITTTLYFLRYFFTPNVSPLNVNRDKGVRSSHVFAIKLTTILIRIPNVPEVMYDLQNQTKEWSRRFSGINSSIIRTVVESTYKSVKLDKLRKKPMLRNRTLKSDERNLNIVLLEPEKPDEVIDNEKIMHGSTDYLELWRNTLPGKTHIILTYLGINPRQVLAFDEIIGFKVIPPTAWNGTDLVGLVNYTVSDSVKYTTFTTATIGGPNKAPNIIHFENFEKYTRTLIFLPGALMVRFEFLPEYGSTKGHYVTSGLAFDAITNRRVLPKYECFVSNADPLEESTDGGGSSTNLVLFDLNTIHNYNINCDSCVNVVSMNGQSILMMVLVFDVHIFQRAYALTPQCRNFLVSLQLNPSYPVDKFHVILP